MGRAAYIGRVAEVAWRDPTEFVDRLRGQWQMRRERSLSKPELTPSGDWVAGIHLLLSEPYPCQICDGFENVWAFVEATLAESGRITGKGHDAGISLARGVYAATRHLRPEHVVETGVARGITTRVILEAMGENGRGTLHSIDLPPLLDGWHAQSALAVPVDMRSDWDYRRGSSRRVLPVMLRNLGKIQLFVHDSLHTFSNISEELHAAWPHIEPGGLVVCDDVEDNTAFIDFAAEVGADPVLSQEERRSGFIGAIVR